MHEAGLTRRILDLALRRAAAAGATRITGLHLEIGAESDVVAESIAFYWPEIARSTPADGAQLFFGRADDEFACRLVAVDVDEASSPER